MSSSTRFSALTAVSALATVFALSACSDVTAPRAADDQAAFTLGPTAPAGGSTVIPFSSSTSTRYCNAAVSQYDPSVPPRTFTLANCNASFDLQLALATYNPGWSPNQAGSSWIGSQADANQYTVPPGTYSFVSAFTIPAGATSPVINDTILSDNAVAVYLNGHPVEAQIVQDCLSAPCNWSNKYVISHSNVADFIIGGENQLTVQLVGTRIGATPANLNGTCSQGPQLFGTAGFSGNFDVPTPQKKGVNWMEATCYNPAALNFSGAATYVPKPPPPRVVAMFVIGDKQPHAVGDNANFWGAQWWKNNSMTGVTDNGVASFKGYAVQSDNVCGGTWTTLPGNSSDPPATIPDDIAVIVTSNVFKNGNKISGNIRQIVMVHHDKNYQDNPGHAGNGPITSVVCGQ